jgi:haloacetate dehalogenase
MVMPTLARDFEVIAVDQRGMGLSDKPAGGYDTGTLADDLVGLMKALGHDRFAVVGHDRGAYAALRTALDHPDAVTGLVVMDAVPIGEALARCNAKFAASWWHWFFLGQTAKPAERVICADPDAWYRADPAQLGEAYEDFRTAIHDPETVHAMCEDYRAGLGIDRAHDDADRAAGRRVACPVLVLWATRDDMEDLYGDPLAIWRDWADDVRGRSLDSGHHMAEEVPGELAAELRAFLG